eukprot:7236483-Heterocapsa_arctica.AAC.1
MAHMLLGKLVGVGLFSASRSVPGDLGADGALAQGVRGPCRPCRTHRRLPRTCSPLALGSWCVKLQA